MRTCKLPPPSNCSMVFVPFQSLEYRSVLPFDREKLIVSLLPGSPQGLWYALGQSPFCCVVR